MPVLNHLELDHPDYIDKFPTHPLDNFTQEEINKKATRKTLLIQMIKPYVCSKSKDVDIEIYEK